MKLLYSPYSRVNYRIILVLIYVILSSQLIAKIGIGYSNEGPLPVELTSFSAVFENNSLTLLWETATEVNNYGFNVQKLALLENDSVWVNLGFVLGNGTTNIPHEYSFVDEINPNLKEVLYRLEQIDIDGETKYSKILVVDLSSITSVEEELPKEFTFYQNYPNPFNPSTIIKFDIPQNSVGKSYNTILKIYDLLGREVAVLLNESINPGFYEIEWNAKGLTSGIYFYQISWNGTVITKKLMLAK
jgi:hypothetical protein